MAHGQDLRNAAAQTAADDDCTAPKPTSRIQSARYPAWLATEMSRPTRSRMEAPYPTISHTVDQERVERLYAHPGARPVHHRG